MLVQAIFSWGRAKGLFISEKFMENPCTHQSVCIDRSMQEQVQPSVILQIWRRVLSLPCCFLLPGRVSEAMEGWLILAGEMMFQAGQRAPKISGGVPHWA